MWLIGYIIIVLGIAVGLYFGKPPTGEDWYSIGFFIFVPILVLWMVINQLDGVVKAGVMRVVKGEVTF